MCVAGTVVAALTIAGCDNHGTSLPVPLYALIKTPPSYRTDDGAPLDNADYKLDAQGYRVNRKGERLDVIDVQAKTADQGSNPVAGYYISSTGTKAAGNVMAPSAGANAGPGYGPGSATVVPALAPGSPQPQPSSMDNLPLPPTPGVTVTPTPTPAPTH